MALTTDKLQMIQRIEVFTVTLNQTIAEAAEIAKKFEDTGYGAGAGAPNEISDADLAENLPDPITHFDANTLNLVFQALKFIADHYNDGEDAAAIPDAIVISQTRIGWGLNCNKMRQA